MDRRSPHKYAVLAKTPGDLATASKVMEFLRGAFLAMPEFFIEVDVVDGTTLVEVFDPIRGTGTGAVLSETRTAEHFVALVKLKSER